MDLKGPDHGMGLSPFRDPPDSPTITPSLKFFICGLEEHQLVEFFLKLVPQTSLGCSMYGKEVRRWKATSPPRTWSHHPPCCHFAFAHLAPPEVP